MCVVVAVRTRDMTSRTIYIGTKPCITCKNVFNRVDAAAVPLGSVRIDCTDTALFDTYSNDEIFQAYDLIRAAPATDTDQLSQCLGLKLNDAGMLFDPHVRTIYRPIDHTLRDWMHVLVSNGVANTETGVLIRALMSHGITLQMISDYMMTFTLPHRNGRVEPTWVAKKNINKEGDFLKSFAGTLLSLVPIMYAFLSDVIVPPHALDDHVLCYLRLTQIIGLCQLGSYGAVPYVGLLRRLIKSHAELYVRVYPADVKPKFHQLMHVPDNMDFLHRLMSCFVTERKHRATKRSALFIFKHIEGTVIRDLVNKQCEDLSDPASSLFSEEFLIRPRAFNAGPARLIYSQKAQLHCGQIYTGDVVYLKSGEVGEVIDFWKASETSCIVVRTNIFQESAVNENRWSIAHPTVRVVCPSMILDAVIYARAGTEIRAILPFKSLLPPAHV